MRRAFVAVIVPLLIIGAPRLVVADEFEVQARELFRGEPFKVRLSAALWLSRRGGADGRAVSLLATALGRDKERTVRHLAATALGEMVGGDTPSAPRARAMSALDRAAATDRDRKVRAAAKTALLKIRARMPRPEEKSDGDGFGGVFLHVGPVVDPARKLPPGGAPKVEAAVRGALVKGELHGAVSQPGKSLPRSRDLRAARQRGFYLGTSIAEVKSRKIGRRLEVRCKLSVRVTPWTGDDGEEKLVAERTASATGSGVVTTAPAGAKAAVLDCLTSVGEEVTARQIVPFLRRFDGRASR